MKCADPRVEFFNRLAENWDNEEPSTQTMAMRLDWHRELLDLKPGQSLLEVGCGTGKTTEWFARAVAPGKVTAVDFSPAMISLARAKNIGADFKCVDICGDMPPDGPYDVVMCFHSFPHFRDQPGALRNLRSCLKPDGRLIVMHLASSAHINGFHSGVGGAIGGDLLPGNDDWPAMLQGAGLGLVELIDRADLFFMEGRPSSKAATGQT